MANTTAVYARIDTDLKNHAESILTKLGITPSGAIQMLYSQIILHNGMPFDLTLPKPLPAAIGSMSRAEFDTELAKGIDSLKTGSYTLDEVDEILAREFAI